MKRLVIKHLHRQHAVSASAFALSAVSLGTLALPAASQTAPSAATGAPASAQPSVSDKAKPSEEVKRGSTTTGEAKSDAAGSNGKSTPAPLPQITAAPGTPEEIAQLRDLVNALTTRLQTLETAQQKTDATVAKNAPLVSSKEKLAISGLLQVHGLNFFGQEGPGPRASDTFRLRRGELRLTGNITPRISGTIMIDPAKNTSISGGALRQRDNVLQEIQLSYLLRKAREGSNNNIYVDVGQYKIPIGYESLVSSSALPFVERALIFTQRDPFDGGYGDVRDTGIQLRGTQGQFEYRLGVFNGIGDRQNTLAASDAKAILARLAYNPKQVPGLQVGISGGRANTSSSASLLEDRRTDRDLFNLFAAYKKNKFSLQAEYLEGDALGLVGGGGALVERELRGYYIGAGYYFTPKLEGVVRYDFLDPTRGTGDSTVRDIIAGLNYYIKGNNAKLQINVLRRNGAEDSPLTSSNPTSDIRNDRTEVRTNFQIAF